MSSPQGSPRSSAGALVFWGVGGAALLYALWAAWRRSWICDDAFISYRYAENLAHGIGLVFNPGERVEGYSNFLWTLFSALVIAGGGKPELWAPVVSAACALATLALVMTFLYRRGRHPGVVGILLAANTGFAAWATSGLETALYTLLVTAGIIATMEALRDPAPPATDPSPRGVRP